MLIRSRANEAVKRVRRLASRKERERTGLYLVEGVQLLEEAVAVGVEVAELVVAPDLLEGRAAQAVSSLRDRVSLLEVTPEVMDSISPRHGHQGVAAVVRQRWERLAEVHLGDDALWVALNGIELPGSLGTIMRVSDAVGGAGAILIGDSADPYDPASVRASLGAVFSQRLVKATLAQFVEWKQRERAFVVGTSPSGEVDYQAIRYPAAVVVFMGGERVGLSEAERAVCDVTVRIPMVGRVESHHVAVATAIVLYEIFSQRRAGRGRQDRLPR